MSLRHDVSQPSSMIEILTSFLLGFRQTNGDPGITTGNYPLVVPQQLEPLTGRALSN